MIRSRLFAVSAALLVIGAMVVASRDSGINGAGWSAFLDFWAAALRPDTSAEFLLRALRAASVTGAYAVLGTAVALIIGVLFGPLLSERFLDLASSGRIIRVLWTALRGVMAILRSIHELVWGLILVQVLGLDPWVAILAIGLPYGSVTAKVFAEFLDTAALTPHQALRRSGAGRIIAGVAALVVSTREDLVAYSFYRFECAMRAAAILGIIGAGGLGSELRISFESLRYEEVWTMLWALVILSALADGWSTLARRTHRDGGRRTVIRWSVAGLLALVPLSAAAVGLGLGRLTSSRTRELAGDLVSRSVPPSLGDQTVSAVASDAIDTLAMSILAISLAVLFGGVAAFLAARPGLAGLPARAVLLMMRAVPAPLWAFVFVLVLLPGIWPGAVALGVYNLGVLGRLQAEVVETLDVKPESALRRLGATPTVRFVWSSLPRVATRFRNLSLYRWEVALRETVVVGVVGAAGLGRTLNQQLAGRAFDQAFFTLLVLAGLTVAIDQIASLSRR